MGLEIPNKLFNCYLGHGFQHHSNKSLFLSFSSFEQTGFVETLKPQFTPGQVLASPGAGLNTSVLSSLQAQSGGGGGDVGERLSHLQLQQENDSLKAQLRDVTEKLDTLKGLFLPIFFFLFCRNFLFPFFK